MELEVLVKLLDAGFTKDEILAINKQPIPKEVTNSDPAALPAEPEVVKPELKAPEQPSSADPEPAPAPAEDRISEAVNKALKPFENLYNQMAKLANMPALDNIQPKGIEDIVSKFFEGE